jgi:hypothetical protein
MFREKVDAIISKLCGYSEGNTGLEVIEATTAILQAIRDELPKQINHWKDCPIHAGYLDGFRDCLDQIKEKLK